MYVLKYLKRSFVISINIIAKFNTNSLKVVELCGFPTDFTDKLFIHNVLVNFHVHVHIKPTHRASP